MAMQDLNKDLDQLIKDKVQAELQSQTHESIKGTKSVKDVAAAILPGIANIISVAVSTAVSAVIKDFTDKIMTTSAETQRINLLQRYDCDRLEQYTRRDNLRIFAIEDPDEDEDVLQAKVMEVAAEVGVKLEANDISIAHRLGRSGERGRPVIVRFCHRKKRNAVLGNKKELKKKREKIFINEDLTPMKATMLKMVKEQPGVSNATTREGKILAWMTGKDRPVEITTPEELGKVGITSPDWKRLRLEHLVK